MTEESNVLSLIQFSESNFSLSAGISPFSPSQSAPTILVLKTVCDPEKKNKDKNMGCKKQGAKSRVILIQKKKRPASLFSFGITMTLFFLALFFLQPIFLDLFF